MWPAANRPARIARHVSWLGLLLIPGVALSFVAPVAAVFVLAIALASELATLTLGCVALSRPRSEGGRGLAVWAVAVSPVFALLSAVALVAMLVVHPAFR